MKPLSRFTLAAAVLLAAALAGACGRRTPATDDFDRIRYAPRYAEGFDIRGNGRDSSALLTVRDPWQQAAGFEQRVLMLGEGRKAPRGFDGCVVRVPVRRVVCLSSSHVALFDAVGQVRRVKGVSGIDYITNPYVREHSLCGEVRDVGYDANLDFELVAALRPDVVLVYGVTGENAPLTGKLRELGIPYIYIGEYMERTPLGRAEWLMVAAELCGCLDEGRRIFAGIADRYEKLKAEVAAAAAPRPRVMCNTPYRDTWFMPSTNSYAIRLLEDAGGEFVYKKNRSNTSVAVDMEEAYLLAREADFWLEVGACNSLAELVRQYPKFADVPAVRNGRVWNNNRRRTPAGGSDYWESGVVRPDRVLRDLVAIFHGTQADTTHYYQRLR